MATVAPATEATVAALQHSLVELIDLALQAKQYHWNVVGPRFRAVHLQLDEITDAVRLNDDDIAEGMAALNVAPGPVPGGRRRPGEAGLDAARPDPVTADTAGRLHAAGLRVTRQRVAILDALAEAGGHRTAEEIARAMAARGRAVPRASLYHALAALNGRRPARRRRGARDHALRGGRGLASPPRLRACGAVIDVPCVRGERPCLQADLPAVVVDERPR